jgi:hypothetical protein
LVLGYPWRHEEQVNYAFPAGVRILHLPAARKVESPFGEFTLAVEASPDGRVIAIRSVLLVAKYRVEPSEYADFRAFLRDTDAALAERVVIALGRTP